MCATRARMRYRPGVLAACVVSGVVIWLAGCSIDFTAETTVTGGGAEPTPDMVTIRFRNLTLDQAVDVEFHATNDPLDNLPDDLFMPEHLVTTSVGVAGTGIIQPLHGDVIEFPCTGDLTIGTPGGKFLDNDTGEERGTGTPRWVQEGQLGLCGTVVTFDFSGTEGAFTTRLSIEG